MIEGFTLPAGVGVEDRITIATPSGEIWRMLEAVGEWGSWNPLYIAAEGSLRVGERIRFTVVLEGMKPQKASAVVRKIEPERFIQYQTSSLGGLVRATRYIALRPTGEGLVEVINGEIMSGPVGRLLGRVVGGKVRNGLAAMNLALKRRAESRQ